MGRSRKSLYWEYKDLCDKNGISKVAFRLRIRRGDNPLDAATRPTGVKRTQIIMPEHFELARKNGLNFHTFTSRVHSYGEEPEEAAKRPLSRKSPVKN